MDSREVLVYEFTYGVLEKIAASPVFDGMDIEAIVPVVRFVAEGYADLVEAWTEEGE